MSFQRKKSRRVTEVKFSKSEIFDEQPSESIADQMSCDISIATERVRYQKFHRKHQKRSHPTSNFFKRMKTQPLHCSSHDLGEELEKKLISNRDLAKSEEKIEDVIMSHQRYVRVKESGEQLCKAERNHGRDNRKLSSLFSDRIMFDQETNHNQDQNRAPNKKENVTNRDLKYLPMHDILNYQGQVTSNPKLIERRLLHKVKIAFMGK